MLELIFAMVVALVWQTIRAGIGACIRKMRAPKPVPLCADCLHAHVQYAANGRRAISCTYSGAVRPITLDVLYCTEYRNRDLPLRPGVIGFVREIAPAE